MRTHLPLCSSSSRLVAGLLIALPRGHGQSDHVRRPYIRDGAVSSADSNSRWPDVLARRLLSSKEPAKAVVNAGYKAMGESIDLALFRKTIAARRP